MAHIAWWEGAKMTGLVQKENSPVIWHLQCCLLHSPSLRQGLGEFRGLPCLLRADFTECPGPLLLWQWVREHEVGKQLGWNQREDKLVQETAGQSFQRSCYRCLLLCSERKQTRVRWLKGTQRWEKKRSPELQHQNRCSFWMTQSRFRVNQITHLHASLSLYLLSVNLLSVCLPMKRQSQTHIIWNKKKWVKSWKLFLWYPGWN